MKKLVRKLALSCAALGVCAATLVSTTFAWYTTNTEVSAANISAGSASTGDSSIFISTDGNNWSQSVDFAGEHRTYYQDAACTTPSTDNAVTEYYKVNYVSMMPVELLEDGTFHYLNVDDAAPTSAYFTFDIYFKTAATSENVNLYLSGITLTNNAAALPQVDNLLNNTDGTGKTNIGVDRNQAKYAVDIVNALALVTTATTAEGSVAEHKNYLDMQTAATPKDSINVETANALAYYNEVMTKNETKGADVQALTTPNFNLGSRSQIATLNKSSASCKVTFTVFLNGWDEYCYDACKGQTFTLGLSFSSNNETPQAGE